MRSRSIMLVAGLTFIAACGDDSRQARELPTAPSKTLSRQTASESIESQIDALFHEPARRAGRALFVRLTDHLRRGIINGARDDMFALVRLTLDEFYAGRLVGGISDPSRRAVVELVDALFHLVRLGPSTISIRSLGSHGATMVVGPAGGTVAVSTREAGVMIPPGALPTTVLVTIARRPDFPLGQGPLGTTLPQYGPFYDFDISPVTTLALQALAGVCQYETGPLTAPASVHPRLHLAKGGTPPAFLILSRLPPPAFLSCPTSSVSGASGESSLQLVRRGAWDVIAERAFDRVARWLTPGTLYAAHGGLGGLISSFSPFGAVDPGAPSSDQLEH